MFCLKTYLFNNKLLAQKLQNGSYSYSFSVIAAQIQLKSVLVLAPSKACYAGQWITLLFTAKAVK